MPDNNHDKGEYNTVDMEAGDMPSWEEWYKAVNSHVGSGTMEWMTVGRPW